MKVILKFASAAVLFTVAVSAQSNKRAAAIREYGELINSMIVAADGLTAALAKAQSAASAARAIDGFSNRMATFQSQLVELDRKNPELEGDEPPAELVGHIGRLEASMSTLAQTLAQAGEKFGADTQFQAAAARLAQTLGADEEGEEEYED